MRDMNGSFRLAQHGADSEGLLDGSAGAVIGQGPVGKDLSFDCAVEGDGANEDD